MKVLARVMGAVLLLSGCADMSAQQAAELNAGLTVAAAATSVYAARSDADPKAVGQLRALLAAAQSAAQTAQATKGSAEQQAAAAALAALVAYQSQLSLQGAAAPTH